ncbi:hypothetical protein AB4K20DRAFT_1887629 [Rhizopus microsporus]
MNDRCPSCNSKELRHEDCLAQCNSCYYSWIYKKSNAIDDFDMDDLFGDLEDIIPKKQKTVEEKNEQIKSSIPSTNNKNTTEKPIAATQRTEYIPKPSERNQSSGMFSDMDDDGDEEDMEPSLIIKRKSMRSQAKKTYSMLDNSHNNSDDDDDYMDQGEYSEDEDGEYKFMDNSSQFDEHIDEIADSEDEKNDYEIYERKSTSGASLQTSRIKSSTLDTKQRKTGAKPTNRYNPFILFNKEMRAKIKEERPELDNYELSRIIGQQWKELDPEKKQAYQILSKRKREDYRNKAIHFAKRPKPPPNVWIVYFKEQVPIVRANNPKLTVNEASTIVSQKWKSLSKEEKDAYKNKAQAARDEFRKMYPEENKAFFDQVSRKVQRTRFKNKNNKK